MKKYIHIRKNAQGDELERWIADSKDNPYRHPSWPATDVIHSEEVEDNTLPGESEEISDLRSTVRILSNKLDKALDDIEDLKQDLRSTSSFTEENRDRIIVLEP